MARRLPGKKFRTEHFHVDGAGVVVDVRIDDDGTFYAWPDDTTRFAASSLAELRTKLKPYLEETRRLVFDPFIDIEFNEAEDRSRSDNLRDRENRQEVLLEFKAGWLSRGSVGNHQRWIDVDVDSATNEIEPLSAWDRQHTYSDRSSKGLIPFTSDRWRRLRAIADALASVRARIADVLQDATGKKLEAVALPKLLGEVQPEKKARAR